MANSIALAQTYLPMLDEVYKEASRTAILDSTNVGILNGNTVKLFKTSMQGMGNYSRNGGYANGDVTASWEAWTLTQDRGRAFYIDRMDNEETIGMAFGTLASEFIRTKVVPEVDAYTFAKFAGTSGITTANADITVGTTDVPALLEAAEQQMNEDEVPMEGRILFISETAHAGLRNKVNRDVSNDILGVNTEVESYNGMRIVRVPQSRFYTSITLRDGTTDGQKDGGYVGTSSTGYKINFMIVHPSAVAKCMKHVQPRIFSPDVVQTADAWKFDYRCYYDCFVRENKVKGIYLHRASTALA